ncbi:hypothetical protein F1880_001396 [Penicillium rolfsii]|nr:hypothetical protein F1880_001396 [Penicillium rolfsii]
MSQDQSFLPFIPSGEVARANGEDGSPLCLSLYFSEFLRFADTTTGIVIDDIVYDLTKFAERHPGGQMPLRNFGGKSCSCRLPWQFHQIHGKHILERHGPELRIGKTCNVPNPFKEQKPSLFRTLWGSHFL